MKFLSRCDFLLHFLCVIPYYFVLSFYRRGLECSALKRELQILEPDVSHSLKRLKSRTALLCLLMRVEEPLLVLTWAISTFSRTCCVTCTRSQHGQNTNTVSTLTSAPPARNLNQSVSAAQLNKQDHSSWQHLEASTCERRGKMIPVNCCR